MALLQDVGRLVSGGVEVGVGDDHVLAHGEGLGAHALGGGLCGLSGVGLDGGDVVGPEGLLDLAQVGELSAAALHGLVGLLAQLGCVAGHGTTRLDRSSASGHAGGRVQVIAAPGGGGRVWALLSGGVPLHAPGGLVQRVNEGFTKVLFGQGILENILRGGWLEDGLGVLDLLALALCFDSDLRSGHGIAPIRNAGRVRA